MNRALKLALLVVAAVVVAQLLARRGSSSSVAAGQPSPPLVLPDLSGKVVDLAHLRGKVVAVNFWATWCPPCKRELPALAEVWRAHQGRCFELLGVAEESGHADLVAAARALPFPVLFDEAAEALEPWGVQGYPATFLVDPTGAVRHVFRGEVGRDELTAAIAPLLPASCPRS